MDKNIEMSVQKAKALKVGLREYEKVEQSRDDLLELYLSNDFTGAWNKVTVHGLNKVVELKLTKDIVQDLIKRQETRMDAIAASIHSVMEADV